jgi:PAS domain S-box-containing protein
MRVVPEHHIRVLETVQKCLSNPGEIVKVEFDKRYRNNTVMNTLWEFVAITDSQNNPIEIQCMGIDITDRKVIETKLEDSERKYKTLFEKSPDANLIIKNDIFIDCNDVAVEMVGGTRDDIIGKSPCKLSPSVQPNGVETDEFSKACYKKIKEGSHSFEWLHKKMDGTPFRVYVKLTAINYDGKDVLFCSWRDITESKNLQEKLILSENRFSEVAVAQSLCYLAELDLNGNYVYLNPVVETVFGYKPEELLGKNSYDLHPPDLKEEYKSLAETLIKENHSIINFENPIQRKDGNVIWVSTSSTPIYDENNRVVKYVGTDVDITERKTAEEELNKFRIIVDQANIGTAITTLEGIITYCNDMFAKLHWI